jgi:hypothetical protein
VGWAQRRPIPGSQLVLRDSLLDIGSYNLDVPFCGFDGVDRLFIANERYVVEGFIAFAAHSVKEREESRMLCVEMLLGKFDDRDVMAELNAWTLTMAQH